jgi:hypothetical protein
MAKEKQEYDYEGDMAMSQLKSIIANAQRIHDMLERDTNIPEWVQSKITLAEDYITTAANYMQGEMKEDVDSYADALIKRNKQNLNKGHVVNAARIAGMDDKKLMAAVNKKVGRIKEEVTHSVHVKTYDSHGEKQMNSPEFKKHVTAHGGEMDYVSDKGAAFKFKSHSHAAAFHRGVQSKFRELDSEHDMHEEYSKSTAIEQRMHSIMAHPVHGRVLSDAKYNKGGSPNRPYISAKAFADKTAARHNKHDSDRTYTVHKLYPDSDSTQHIIKVSGPKRTGYFAEEGEGGPVNVAANVADPQNKKLFGKPAKRKMPSFKSFAKK